ncbi:hypothetical protein CL6EHI_c00047 [Entamoeba histolytica]|uniref:Uncharacterized protein n=1 Tax=Entamoeba histolytica TaxID=5759 RepID=A0A175JGG2_ENTHI|nr:hypothetical protein CL6EHI_c00047 [Entamoeba histolytica]
MESEKKLHFFSKIISKKSPFHCKKQQPSPKSDSLSLIPLSSFHSNCIDDIVLDQSVYDEIESCRSSAIPF